jgi:hypothetical protein
MRKSKHIPSGKSTSAPDLGTTYCRISSPRIEVWREYTLHYRNKSIWRKLRIQGIFYFQPIRITNIFHPLKNYLFHWCVVRILRTHCVHILSRIHNNNSEDMEVARSQHDIHCLAYILQEDISHIGVSSSTYQTQFSEDKWKINRGGGLA